MRPPRSAPSPRKIAECWAASDVEWAPTLTEPCCFACGWVKLHLPKLTWGNAGLERCHILAYPLVEDVAACRMDPANYLLLCRRCHLDAPMSALPRILLDWVELREHWFAFQARSLETELAKVGSSIADLGCRLQDWEVSFFVEFAHAVEGHVHPQRSGAACEVGLYVPLLMEFLRQKEEAIAT